MTGAFGYEAIALDEVTPVEVGPGCRRRDLPSRDGVRIWVVDMDPGAEWPRVDRHDAKGEDIYVGEGELIEGDERFRAGTFLQFAPGSSHRPRTETGVRLFGFNLQER